ncbi:hypothetical protein Ddc_18999 [Ditylenchus destructor]|nr:hypothetical protein Ddc_18999 [Ditylenchus destructor]
MVRHHSRGTPEFGTRERRKAGDSIRWGTSHINLEGPDSNRATASFTDYGRSPPWRSAMGRMDQPDDEDSVPVG